MTNYVQRVIDKLSDRHPRCKPELIEMYALLALVRGEKTTLEDVHDAWSVWKNQHRPDHWSLIPFNELTAEKQALDQKYVDSIHIVARTG